MYRMVVVDMFINGVTAMKFLCLVHFAPGAFEGMTEDQGRNLNDATIEHDRMLRAAGVLLIASPLTEPQEGANLDRRRLRLDTVDGPFSEAKEVVGGFLLVQANSLGDAVKLFDDAPIAAYARLEIRPLNEAQSHSSTGEERPEFQPV